MYAYRIIRPVWRMKITNYTKVAFLDRQEFNTDLLMPVFDKLINL